MNIQIRSILLLVCIGFASAVQADSIIKERLAFLPHEQLNRLDRLCNHVYILAVKPTCYRLPGSVWITNTVRQEYEQQVVNDFLAKRKELLLRDGCLLNDANQQALDHIKVAQFAKLDAFSSQDLSAINDKRVRVYRKLFNKDLTSYQMPHSEDVDTSLNGYQFSYKPQGSIHDVIYYKTRAEAFKARFPKGLGISSWWAKANLLQNFVASANLRSFEERDYLERKVLISEATPVKAKG